MGEPWENEDGSTNVQGWLAAYAADDNTFWRTETGHIMNVVDQLIEWMDPIHVRYEEPMACDHPRGQRVFYIDHDRCGRCGVKL